MRILTLAASAALVCGLAMAGTHSQEVTYVDGNVAGVSNGSTGTLMDKDTALEIRSGLATVSVPYSNITSASLGAVRREEIPLYHVWSLHKRVLGRNETQQLKLEFTEEGEPRMLTIEMSKAGAEGALSAIQERTKAPETAAAPAPSSKEDAWWGDNLWKTNRNADNWPRQTAKVPE